MENEGMKGKVALVTGSSRGIGSAIAKKLASMGMDICINYNGSLQGAQDTAAACESFGVKTYICKADMSSSDDISRLCQETVDALGGLHVLVNNAGITRDSLLIGMKDEDIEAVLDTNLKSAIICSREAAKIMIRQKYGRIINISSVIALRGNAGQCNYAAAKAGLIGFTKSLAREVAKRNITVNAIAPGYIDTDMTMAMSDAAKKAVMDMIPMKIMGTGENIADAAAFLAGNGAAYITGQVLAVDGGMSI